MKLSIFLLQMIGLFKSFATKVDAFYYERKMTMARVQVEIDKEKEKEAKLEAIRNKKKKWSTDAAKLNVVKTKIKSLWIMNNQKTFIFALVTMNINFHWAINSDHSIIITMPVKDCSTIIKENLSISRPCLLWKCIELERKKRNVSLALETLTMIRWRQRQLIVA